MIFFNKPKTYLAFTVLEGSLQAEKVDCGQRRYQWSNLTVNPINYNTVTRHVPPNCSIPFKLKHFLQEEREAKEPQEVNKRSQTSHERENKNLEDC